MTATATATLMIGNADWRNASSADSARLRDAAGKIVPPVLGFETYASCRSAPCATTTHVSSDRHFSAMTNAAHAAYHGRT